MGRTKLNKGQKSRRHNEQKMRFKINKIYYYVAHVIKPDWTLKELKMLICERLSNSVLHFIVDSDIPYYSDMREAAFNELTERKILGKEIIHEDPIKVEENYRKANSRR